MKEQGQKRIAVSGGDAGDRMVERLEDRRGGRTNWATQRTVR